MLLKPDPAPGESRKQMQHGDVTATGLRLHICPPSWARRESLYRGMRYKSVRHHISLVSSITEQVAQHAVGLTIRNTS